MLGYLGRNKKLITEPLKVMGTLIRGTKKNLETVMSNKNYWSQVHIRTFVVTNAFPELFKGISKTS